MALKLDFEQIDNGETFKITDVSDDGTDYTGATVKVKRSGTWYTVVENPGDGWSSGSTVKVETSDISQDEDKFTDGIYEVEYNADSEDKVTYNTLLDYNVRYCVYNILRLLPDVHNCNVCSNQKVQRAIFMFTYLKSLEWSASAGQITEIQRILQSLQNLCKNPYIDECYSN